MNSFISAGWTRPKKGGESTRKITNIKKEGGMLDEDLLHE